MQLAASLKHPLIARVFDSGLDRLDYFYVMELIEGEPIDIAVAEGGFNTREIVKLIKEVCEAVGYAHERGVVHLDLKPTNILVSDDGQPHVLDFGLARAVGSEQSVDRLPPYRAGTLGYMAPEQDGKAGGVNQRTDVYALGRILCELLRCANDQHNVAQAADLESIIRKATADHPSHRYEDAADMGLDLTRWLGLRPVSSMQRSIRYTSFLWVKRNRNTLRRLAFILIPLIVMTAAIGTALYRKDASNRTMALQNDATLYQSTIKSVRERLNRGDTEQAQRLLADTPPEVRGWEWTFLDGLADPSIHTIMFDSGVIRDFTILEGGTLVCMTSSGELNRIRLQEDKWTVNGTDTGVDLPKVLGANADYLLHLDQQGRGALHYLGQTKNSQSVRLTDTALTHVKVSPSGRYVLAGAHPDALIVYDTAKREVAYRAQHPNGVYVSCFSHDDRYAVWYGDQYNVLDLENNTLISWTNEQVGRVSPNALAAVGGSLYSGSADGAVWVHGLEEHTQPKRLASLPVDITTIAVSTDGRVIACGGVNGDIHLITDDQQPHRILSGHVGAVIRMRFSDDGRRLYSLSSSGKVKVWDTDWAAYEAKPWPTEHATLSAMDSSGRILACALQDSIATVFDSQIERSEALSRPQHTIVFDSSPTALALTHDSRWLGVAMHDRFLQIYDGDMALANYKMAHEPAYWLDFNIADKRLAASNSQEVLVVEAGNDKPIRWLGRSGPCAWLKTQPTWLGMIRLKQDGYAFEVRDVDTDLQILLDPLGQEPIIAMTVASGAVRVAVAGSEGKLKVYDIETGNEYNLTSPGDIGSVLALALSPDGKRLITAGDNVVIWSVDQGEVLDVLQTPTEGPIMAIEFTEDGEELIGRGLTAYYRWRTR